MKRCGIILCFVLFVPYFSFAQGGSCATPIPIPLDGVCRDYTISSSTGGNNFCASTGTSPITFFSVTSNSSGECMILDITGPNSSPVEVAMYTNGACTNPNLETASSMCLFDGNGLWAPAETFTVTPNTTYILRIKTSTTGTIRICGKNYTPPNNTCLGATPIGPFLIDDNNACAKPGTGIVPAQLCATTLENTLFYTYIVEVSGITSLSIENTTCDNASNPGIVGFQIGFFTGDCSLLTYFYCYHGTGSNIQVNTDSFPAGTKIYVAVDGIGGSNCAFSIRAINAIVLSATLKHFNAWKVPEGNILKWSSIREVNNGLFQVQRSIDGINFVTIGNISGHINSNTEKKYQFSDLDAPERCFYRLKQVSTQGNFTYSNIIEVNRGDLPRIKIKLNNPVSQMLNMTISLQKNSAVEIVAHNMNGAIVFQDKINCYKGTNNYLKNLSSLPTGRYIITARTNEWKDVQRFLKFTQ